MKLESNFKNMVLVLTIITLIAAGALGAVYTLTEEPIALSKKLKQENAIKEVLPEHDRIAEPDTVNDLQIHKAYKADVFVGAAVESFSKHGFGGEIKIMVGFDKDGNIVNYSVLKQMETPGLGTKMVEWFKTDKNKQDIRGLNPATTNLTVSKDGGDVDAITASTISSRAFLEAVRLAYDVYANNPTAPSVNADAQSGATQSTDSVQMTDTINIQNPEMLNNNEQIN